MGKSRSVLIDVESGNGSRERNNREVFGIKCIGLDFGNIFRNNELSDKRISIN